MKKTSNGIIDPNEEKKFEKEIYDALILRGDIIPSTPEEVVASESMVNKEDIQLPNQLRNPLEVLKRGRARAKNGEHIRIRNKFPDASDELACAARDGGEISEETAKLMKKSREQVDREWAEKNDPRP